MWMGAWVYCPGTTSPEHRPTPIGSSLLEKDGIVCRYFWSDRFETVNQVNKAAVGLNLSLVLSGTLPETRLSLPAVQWLKRKETWTVVRGWEMERWPWLWPNERWSTFALTFFFPDMAMTSKHQACRTLLPDGCSSLHSRFSRGTLPRPRLSLQETVPSSMHVDNPASQKPWLRRFL